MTIRVFLEPTGLHSRAMVRVAKALERYAPPGVRVVRRIEDADLVLCHVISEDALRGVRLLRPSQRYVVAQYCVETTGLPNVTDWLAYWCGAELVWSYYDLSVAADVTGFRFLHAPLGLDDVFREALPDLRRERLIVTTGYVSGPNAEAIAEVWKAARRLGMEAFHVGPKIVDGMARPHGWQSAEGVDDDELASLYRRATWVAALRHVEGFELPAAEALACGARPIVFDQPTMRYWYGDRAVRVPECEGAELVDRLVSVMSEPRPVSEVEREQALARFDWSVIANAFWRSVLSSMEVAA